MGLVETSRRLFHTGFEVDCAQSGQHVGGRLGPFRWVLGQQPQNEGVQGPGALGVVPGGGHRRRVDVLPDDAHRIVSQEGRAPCDHLVEHGPQGVQVGLGGHVAAHGLFRRHIGHGAHHHPFQGKPRAVQGHRQSEVADLGCTFFCQPHIPRLQVPVDDAPAVGKLQASAGLLGDLDCLLQGKPVVCGIIYQTLYIASAHELGDHVGLALVLAQVENGDDMGVGAQPAHGLGFSGYAGAAGLVQALGLDQGEGHLPVQCRVVGLVNPLLAAFAQEPFNLVAAVGE